MASRSDTRGVQPSSLRIRLVSYRRSCNARRIWRNQATAVWEPNATIQARRLTKPGPTRSGEPGKKIARVLIDCGFRCVILTEREIVVVNDDVFSQSAVCFCSQHDRID